MANADRKIVVVTGARGQIGKVLVDHLSSTFEVCAIDISPPLGLENEWVREFSVDITAPKQVKNFVSGLGKPVWGLINNAGKGVYTDFFDRTAEELESVIAVNDGDGIFHLESQDRRSRSTRKMEFSSTSGEPEVGEEGHGTSSCAEGRSRKRAKMTS